MALEINSQNFEQLATSGQLVVVDFWATWCGPCQLVGPHIEKLAHEYEGKAVIGKCDVDRDQELPSRFGIRNIPTILFIKNGKEAAPRSPRVTWGRLFVWGLVAAPRSYRPDLDRGPRGTVPWHRGDCLHRRPS